MTLAAGTRLGPYEILSAIGAGGMGEVYKARDTRLNRTVAIKILPDALAADSQFRDRFDREARTISQLDHPHICTLYDVGEQNSTSFLVMQYLEGETLEARLKKGALPLDQALQYAIQMADALAVAHRAGIVHRDLKPGNIMLTKSGAKLLDFGLAKAAAPIIAGAGLSTLPTTPPITQQGSILGTFQYMAPEQLEGQEADARTDIFAFGAVVYEMVTGKKAFEGKSQASVIGAILEREPPLVSTTQPLAPVTLDRAVRKCLAKDPGERWQTVHDLRDELQWVFEPASTGLAAAPITEFEAVRRITGALRLWMTGAVVFGLMTIALAALEAYRFRSAAEPEIVRFTVAPPENMTFAAAARDSGVATSAGRIAPDGRKLAYTAQDPMGTVLLWIRLLDTLAARPLPGTEGAALPFWSPDSRWVGFLAQGKLKKVDVTGGPPQVLCDAQLGRGGGTWNATGSIVFAPNSTGLSRVDSAGGEPVVVTSVGHGQTGHVYPSFLPDGRHFLYYAQAPSPESAGVFVGTLDSSTSGQRLLAADSAAIYAPPGYLLFVRQGALLAQPFDATTQQLGGDPVRLADSVAFDRNAPGFSVSEHGTLTYRTGPSAQSLQFAWFDRTGKLLEPVGSAGDYHGVDLSVDGTRVAVHRHEGSGGDIWIFEPRGTTTRLTFNASQDNSSPIWSPDGSQVAFASLRAGKWGVYQKASNGTGAEEPLAESEVRKNPMAWSRDGKYLVYALYEQKGTGQWLLPITGDRKPMPLLNAPFNEAHPQLSPDGKWMAYNSNQTGRAEVYVKPFPSGDGQWQISTAGGIFPRWRGDSKELFYFTSTTTGKLMAVEVSGAGSTFDVRSSRELFDTGYFETGHLNFSYHVYAVSADGQRFLIPRSAANLAGLAAPAPITVVLNWTAPLKK